MMDEGLLKRARAQVANMDRYGLQARRELSDTEVGELCRAFLVAAASIAQLQALVRSADKRTQQIENERDEVRKQRDSANGKLSALQRKYDSVMAELRSQGVHRE